MVKLKLRWVGLRGFAFFMVFNVPQIFAEEPQAVMPYGTTQPTISPTSTPTSSTSTNNTQTQTYTTSPTTSFFTAPPLSPVSSQNLSSTGTTDENAVFGVVARHFNQSSSEEWSPTSNFKEPVITKVGNNTWQATVYPKDGNSNFFFFDYVVTKTGDQYWISSWSILNSKGQLSGRQEFNQDGTDKRSEGFDYDPLSGKVSAKSVHLFDNGQLTVRTVTQFVPSTGQKLSETKTVYYGDGKTVKQETKIVYDNGVKWSVSIKYHNEHGLPTKEVAYWYHSNGKKAKSVVTEFLPDAMYDAAGHAYVPATVQQTQHFDSEGRRTFYGKATYGPQGYRRAFYSYTYDPATGQKKGKVSETYFADGKQLLKKWVRTYFPGTAETITQFLDFYNHETGVLTRAEYNLQGVRIKRTTGQTPSFVDASHLRVTMAVNINH